LVLVVRITKCDLVGDKKMVEKPPEVGGPMVPRIPLYLARIRADALLTLRGPRSGTVEFYSWVWASGSHGGPRLFHPSVGSGHVVFLRHEGPYLRTVGDYPSYDLELSSRWLPGMVASWASAENSGSDVFESLVAARLRAEFNSLAVQDLRQSAGGTGPVERDYFVRGLPDLVRLVGPLFVAVQLDDICQHSANPAGRAAACLVAYEYFPGRCDALEITHGVLEGLGVGGRPPRAAACPELDRQRISELRAGQPGDYLGSTSARLSRREVLRLYASAMDAEVHAAACGIAASEGTRDLPECVGVQVR
jgi:hypothetical protein